MPFILLVEFFDSRILIRFSLVNCNKGYANLSIAFAEKHTPFITGSLFWAVLRRLSIVEESACQVSRRHNEYGGENYEIYTE